jgi:dephospho-CoA kinase
MKIVGFAGRKRAGKDEAAKYLVEHCRFQRLSFADALKSAAREIFGLTEDQMYGAEKQKEAVDEFWGKSPRLIMQLLGTEVGRAIDVNVWVKSIERKLVGLSSIVIPDCRFQNEADMIRRNGGIIVRIDRPSLGPQTDMHASETSLANYEFDDIIVNDGTLNDLYSKVQKLFLEYEGAAS